MKHEKVYLLTDGCGWEINRQTGNEHPHSVEVVDLETGAVRYITSGSKITFIEGKISDIRTQEAYNKEIEKAQREVPDNKQDMPERTERKGKGTRGEPKRKTTGV